MKIDYNLLVLIYFQFLKGLYVVLMLSFHSSNIVIKIFWVQIVLKNKNMSIYFGELIFSFHSCTDFVVQWQLKILLRTLFECALQSKPFYYGTDPSCKPMVERYPLTPMFSSKAVYLWLHFTHLHQILRSIYPIRSGLHKGNVDCVSWTCTLILML